MTTLQALILGIIQGLTEFLPISSSGHLVLFQKLFGINTDVLSFDVAVHFATLIAVVIVFWRDLAEMIKKPFGKLPLLLIAGTAPTVIIGLLLNDFFEELYISGASLGFEFIFTGIILLYAEKTKNKNKDLVHMNYRDALFIGTAQGLAILPAVSRSGLTLAGGLFRGLNREFVLKFSFLMSIPAILGSAVFSLKDFIEFGGTANPGMEPAAILAGMIAAAVSGYLAIKFMLMVFSKVSLKIFSYYVFIVGAVVLIDQLFFGRFFTRLF